MTVELLAHLVLHELHELVLDTLPFRFSGNHFPLGGMFALGRVVVQRLGLRPGQVHGEKPMDHQVRIAADRGGEMRIELEGQSVVADVVGTVAGLGHGPEGEDLDGAQFRLVLRIHHQAVQGVGDVLAGADGPHLVAEVAGELPQTGDLLQVGLVMDPVHEGLGILDGLAAHLAVRGDELGDVFVRQKHEFLDEPVGLLGIFLVHGHRLAVFVDLHLHFGTLEVHGAGSETLFAELQGYLIEDQHRFLHVIRNDAAFGSFAELRLHSVVPGLDDGLGALVGEAVVGLDDRPAEPGIDDLRERGDLEHGGEGELLLVRTQGAQFVGEFLRQHGHGPVHQINGCPAGLGLHVHRSSRLDVVGNVGDMDAHLVVAVVQLAEGQGVVEVLRIGRVDGEGQDLAEVLAAGAVLVGDFLGNPVGSVLHGLFELVGKAELGEDRVHLGIVLARHAQYVHDMPVGPALTALPAIHDGGDFHAADTAFRDGDGDIVRHGLGGHEHPGTLADDVEDPHKRLLRALYDGNDLAAAPLGVSNPFLGDSHPDSIPVQGAAGLGRLDIHVFFLSLDPDEHESFPGHHGRSLVLGNDPDFLLPSSAAGLGAAVPAAFSSGHRIMLILYKDTNYSFFRMYPGGVAVNEIILDEYRHINNSVIYYDISNVLLIFAKNI